MNFRQFIETMLRHDESITGIINEDLNYEVISPFGIFSVEEIAACLVYAQQILYPSK